MTKIQIELTNEVAKVAREAGQRLLEAVKRIHAVSGEPMSMDEIDAVVKAVRAERRQART